MLLWYFDSPWRLLKHATDEKQVWCVHTDLIKPSFLQAFFFLHYILRDATFQEISDRKKELQEIK